MRFPYSLGRLALGAVLLVVLTVPLPAQVERASIVGTITDNSGALVPGVEVRVTHETTNTTTTTQTDAAGNYTAPNLVPGSYTITAQHTGFTTRSFKGVVVQVGQTARIDVQLLLGAVEQTVEVIGTVPLLQTENATVGQVIGSDPINALPLNGRNFVQLAMMAPGVVGLDYGSASGINSGVRNDELRPGGTQLQSGGVNMMQNQVLIDGIDDSEIVSGTFVVRPMLENVQEFQVITNNAGAEFGRAGGATLVINTKSGGNAFHGSAYEYLRNDAFDAHNFFDRPGVSIPPYKMNQFGASLGGPVVLPKYNGHNRTFFFMDYEGQHEILGLTYTLTVPTAAMRTGNFQGVVANGIYDPASTTQVGTGYTRTRFANDQIPAERFDRIGVQLLNLYPLPQKSGLANNYVSNPVKRSFLNRSDLRIDHQVSQKNSLFARFSIDQADFTIPDTFNSVIGGQENSFAGPATERGINAVIADTHTFGASMVADFRFGYTRIDYQLSPSVLSSPVWKQIPGRDTTDPYQPSAPIIAPSGWGGLGDSRSLGCLRREDNKEFIGNVSWQKSGHDLKWGADVRRRWVNETSSPQGQNAFGRFNFSSGYTNNPAATSGTGYVGASMILGLPTQIAREMFIVPVKNIYTWEPNFYFRDQWRISRNLTLNLGVHYEIDTPFVEGDNHWAVFNPVTAKLDIAGRNGVDRYAGLRPNWGGVGPRISFAYQAGSKTVVRGGFGRFYDPQEAQNNIRQSSQWPFDFIYTYTPGDLFPDRTVSQGFPLLKDLPSSIDVTNPDNPFGNLRAVTPDFKYAAYNQYNLGVQRKVTSTVAVTVSYVGNSGSHLAWTPPINNPTPGPGAITPRRPYYSRVPNVVSISYLTSSANSNYNAMQTSVEKRLSAGFYLLANWTWSHAMDNWNVMNPNDRRREWASTGGTGTNAGLDLRQQARLSWRYTLPFGGGQRFWNTGVAGKVVGGWELAGITVLQSGVPFSVTSSSDPTNTGASGVRADVLPGGSGKIDNPTPDRWFNPSDFKIPSPYNWGNTGRNILTGPRLYNFDFALSRKFNITERTNLTFRGEAFNGLNTPSFAVPASVIGNVGVGTVSATVRANRQVQLALRLAW